MSVLVIFVAAALCVLCAACSPAFWERLQYLRKRIQGLGFLLKGPYIIDHEYSTAEGPSFKVPTPSNDLLMVTSSDLIKEVLAAPRDSLSLHAVAKEILQPRYTMYGFEWNNQRGVEGTGFVRALRSLLTSHLPHFREDLDRIIRASLGDELKDVKADGFSHAQLFPMVKRTITRTNCFVFFGEELSNNAEFTAAALEFPQTVVVTAEAVRMVPEFMRPLVAQLVTRRHRAAKTLVRYLEPIVKERLAVRAQTCPDEQVNKPVDCMQWIIDTSPRKEPWSSSRMIGEIMAIWFSSVHQLAMTTTYVLQDLSLHSEYKEPLREEIAQHAAESGTASIDVEKLPLLDSFVKESVRCSNVDAVSCRRKALAPYVFSDGSGIAPGDWVCIPQRAMMQDAARYAAPASFDGFRFARANELLRIGRGTSAVPDKAPATLTTSTEEWPIWGLGTTACPGRFYASLVLKLLVVQVLTEWEYEMPETGTPWHMTWRSSLVPRDGTMAMFRKQKGMTDKARDGAATASA